IDGVLIVSGRENDRGRIFERIDVTRHFDAGDAGHSNVEQHDVGSKLSAQGERFLAVGRLADDFAIADLLEQSAQALTRRRLVVNDQQLHTLSVVPSVNGKMSLARNSPSRSVVSMRACPGHASSSRWRMFSSAILLPSR